MSAPVRTCIHTKTNGIQCGSPAMRGDLRCYYHYRQRKPIRELVDIGDISTPNGRKEALGVIYRAMIHRRIDNSTAGHLLYMIQIAMQGN